MSLLSTTSVVGLYLSETFLNSMTPSSGQFGLFNNTYESSFDISCLRSKNFMHLSAFTMCYSTSIKFLRHEMSVSWIVSVCVTTMLKMMGLAISLAKTQIIMRTSIRKKANISTRSVNQHETQNSI